MAHETNKHLRELIAEHQLTRAEVARLTLCRSKSTVDRWLLPSDNHGYRRMPAHRMKLLIAELMQRKREPTNGSGAS